MPMHPAVALMARRYQSRPQAPAVQSKKPGLLATLFGGRKDRRTPIAPVLTSFPPGGPVFVPAKRYSSPQGVIAPRYLERPAPPAGYALRYRDPRLINQLAAGRTFTAPPPGQPMPLMVRYALPKRPKKPTLSQRTDRFGRLFFGRLWENKV